MKCVRIQCFLTYIFQYKDNLYREIHFCTLYRTYLGSYPISEIKPKNANKLVSKYLFSNETFTVVTGISEKYNSQIGLLRKIENIDGLVNI